jgi:hypothetical protein
MTAAPSLMPRRNLYAKSIIVSDVIEASRMLQQDRAGGILEAFLAEPVPQCGAFHPNPPFGLP